MSLERTLTTPSSLFAFGRQYILHPDLDLDPRPMILMQGLDLDHNLDPRPKTLYAGWRSILEALKVAAADVDPAVVNHALDAVQPVIEALYSSGGAHLSGIHLKDVDSDKILAHV